MASLNTAYTIVTNTSTASYTTLRNQISMAVWVVAGEKRNDTSLDWSSGEFDIARRVLAGDTTIASLAVNTFATDFSMQDTFTNGGNKISDEELLNYIRKIWPQLAGMM